MEDFNEKIQKAINEELPKHLGEALQKRLSSLEKIEQDYHDLSDLYNNQSKENAALIKERDKLNKDLAERIELLTDIDKREKFVEETINKLKVNELEIRLQEAGKRGDEMKELIGLVFKSPVYRKTYDILGGTTHHGNDQFGNPIYSSPNDKHGSEETTVE